MFKTLRKIVDYTGQSLAVQEVLYGLIMALLFVTAARFGVVSDATSTIILVLGMNFTWGMIDMIIFWMVDRFDQTNYIRIVSEKDKADDPKYVEDVIRYQLSGTLVDIIDDEDEKKVVQQIMGSRLEPQEDIDRERRDMLVGAFSCFVITILTTLPVIIPLLVIPDFNDALFVASACASVCLFFTGYLFAPYIGKRRIPVGLVFMAIGWAITLIATFTGG